MSGSPVSVRLECVTVSVDTLREVYPEPGFSRALDSSRSQHGGENNRAVDP